MNSLAFGDEATTEGFIPVVDGELQDLLDSRGPLMRRKPPAKAVR